MLKSAANECEQYGKLFAPKFSLLRQGKVTKLGWIFHILSAFYSYM